MDEGLSVGELESVGAGLGDSVLGDSDGAAVASAIAFSSAATVAASTVPDGGTPRCGLEVLECLGQRGAPLAVDGTVPEAGERERLLHGGGRGHGLLGGGSALGREVVLEG